jgi:hypothetical protein
MDMIGRRARAAAAELAFAPSAAKAAALQAAADAIIAQTDAIIAANGRDLDYGRDKGLSPAMMDRLMLDGPRIRAIAAGLRAVAEQADPVGRVLAAWDRPNGLHIRRVATPLGVVGVIYESRPNVTADAGALCLKAGNAVILRGGSESFHSSGAIHACLVAGLRAVGLPEDAVAKYPSELSGGMKKRAGLARALALDPELLFLDEPTAGLDPIGAAAFDHLTRELKATLGLTVFLITHDLDTLYEICDRVAVIAEKRIIALVVPTGP